MAEALSGSRVKRDRVKRRWEVADTVVAAGVGLVAVVSAIFVVLCFQGYDTTLEGAKNKAQRAAAVMAEGSRWIIAATIVSLERAVDQIAANSSNGDVAEAFDRSSASLPSRIGLGVYSDAGQLLWANADAAPASIEEADFFADIEGGEEVSLGRLEPQGNSARFAVARRLQPDGAFAGAVVAMVSGETLSHFATSQDLGANSTVSLIRSDGKVVSRDPPIRTPVDLSHTDAFAKLNQGGSGSYVSETSPVDGLPRIVGFQHVEDLHYIALASISSSVAFGGLWYSIWVVSLLLAPFALVAITGSIWAARLLRRAQASSRTLGAALERNEQLFREIHHRVKNNLQSVNALLQVHAIPIDVKEDLARRIFAMSAVHEHIYRTGDFSDVRVRDYLHTLIANVRSGADSRITVVDELDDVTVDKDAAGPLGLILNEILSNAFKHAFSDGRSGTVRVSLRRVEVDLVQLVISDDGVGFDPNAPIRGIGRKLVAGFVKQVRGQSSYSSENGSRFTLTFPGR